MKFIAGIEVINLVNLNASFHENESLKFKKAAL